MKAVMILFTIIKSNFFLKQSRKRKTQYEIEPIRTPITPNSDNISCHTFGEPLLIFDEHL